MVPGETPDYAEERPVPCRVVPLERHEEDVRGRLDSGLREVLEKELTSEGEEVPADLSSIRVQPTHLVDLNLLKAELSDEDMRYNVRVRKLAQECEARVVTPVSIMSPPDLVKELAQSQVTVVMPLLIGYIRRPVYHHPEEAFTCKLRRSYPN